MNNEQKQVTNSQACTSLRVRQYMWKHENTLECQKKIYRRFALLSLNL